MKKLWTSLFATLFLMILCNSNAAGQVPLKKIHFSNRTSERAIGSIRSDFITPVTGYNVTPFPYLSKQISDDQIVQALDGPKVLDRDLDGRVLAISYQQRWPKSIGLREESTPASAAFLKTVSDRMQLPDAQDMFKVQSVDRDDLGMVHVRMQQVFQSIPVFGGQVILHGDDKGFDFLNGRYFLIGNSTPSPEPTISYQQAMMILRDNTQEGILEPSTDKNVPDNMLISMKSLASPPEHELVYLPMEQKWLLTWHITYYTSVLDRWESFVDAHTGEMVKTNYLTCTWARDGHHHGMKWSTEDPSKSNRVSAPTAFPYAGDRTATGKDLNGQTKTIHVWSQNGTNYLIDASRPMFNSGASQMPDNPVGALITLDAGNTHPQNNDFKVGLPASSNNQWDPLQISAHNNGALAYEYYRQTHSRNAIDGAGGNIISIYNVSETDGGGMDNAFWNGKAMFYGNGRSQFNRLAAGLDVAAHEMTHGVTFATANLVYEGESGAINESMSDVFGVMVDRGDWTLGENVVKGSAFPSGALRDMSDPHNGASNLGQPGFQPKHVNEQYHGQQDNGGVHINSGIPNYAFYLFVQAIKNKDGSEEVAKSKAEKVYYRTLTKYLTRSSKFVDLKVAVMRAAKDLYGSAYETLARNAFTAVGIGGNGGGGGSNHQKDLAVNPGVRYLIANDDQYQNIVLFNINTQANGVPLYSQGVKSKVSMTDDGAFGVFVGKDGNLYGLQRMSGDNYNVGLVSDQGPYRNAVISKDGKTLAYLADTPEPKIYLWSFDKNAGAALELYNPTTADGVKTGDVQYADAMEFDPSGEYLVYDALSKIRSTTGQDYEYWDIGFAHVWSNSTNNWSDGEISKLISNLPEGLSIGNPTLAKNSPYIMAFDLLDSRSGSAQYAVFGANIEKNELNSIFQNDQVGFPNFSVDDKFLVFNAADQSNGQLLAVTQLTGDKIHASGQPSILLNGGRWGVNFADGKRNLYVKTKDVMALKKSNLSLVQNPVSGDAMLINMGRTALEDLVVTVADQDGKVVLRHKVKKVLANETVMLHTASLLPSVYILSTKGQGFSEQYKMIKE